MDNWRRPISVTNQCMHSPEKAYVCEGQAIAMYAQSWEGLGLWGTSQSMHSPEKVYVCEGQAKVCTVLRRPRSEEGEAAEFHFITLTWLKKNC